MCVINSQKTCPDLFINHIFFFFSFHTTKIIPYAGFLFQESMLKDFQRLGDRWVLCIKTCAT